MGKKMAKVTAPFLSIAARGKIAGTLVASVWKGINTMRQYVRPANPNTADQETQRTLFKDCVAFWRASITDAKVRAAWNRAAGVLADVMSGFNAAMRNMVKVVSGDSVASFVSAVEGTLVSTKIDVDFLNADDGAAGDESGNFELWLGTTPTNLMFIKNGTIADGSVSYSDASIVADRYFQIRKGAYSRSGIHSTNEVTA